jgi:threonine dehydratase
MIERADVLAARNRIVERVRVTPVLVAGRVPAGRGGSAVTLKLEQHQHTGSFKARGAFNRLLSVPPPAAGVVTASGGNAGLAVAYAARVLGHHAEVFVPESCPRVKIDRLRELGAEVTVGGAFYADAYAAALDRQDSTGASFVHAYDQPEVVAGQGTLALELAEQAPELDTVLVAVGGGGLIGGVAAAYEGRVRIVAVEPAAAPTLRAALDAGEPVEVEVGGVAADSLGARRLGSVCWSLLGRFPVSSVLIDDAAVVAAQRLLWRELRVAAEPGGAVALAALTGGAYRPVPGERVGVIICGGNTDPASLA